ncbi:hypothetical protein MGN70_009045 [Eutypa lata]|nr:hypothetical protein MGN70_009045 [Eutypa lata]
MQLPRYPSQRPLAILAALLAAAPLAVGSRYRYLGCFETPTDLDHDGRSTFQSVGLCARHCRSVPVYGLSNGTECFCGSVAPPWEQLVGEELCNRPCPGYPRDTCGGMGFFSIYVQEQTTSPNETLSQSRSAEPEATREAVVEQPPILRTEGSDGSFSQHSIGS